MDNFVFSLYELNHIIKRTISGGLPDLYWVRAETSDVRENQNGHCYLEFIQKDEQTKNTLAKAGGTIWANTYRMLKPYFEEETGQAFSSGLKVLVLISVEFHEIYGFRLNVHDIDPSYTLGDQARHRAEIIKQLKEEGVFELNKELPLPYICNRIAIISSPTAAGYEDFTKQLNNNRQGFVFYPFLFPAIMQGEKAEDSILSALDKINGYRDCFDAVVIIRGGGATSDLSCFDSYLLAASCAQFPLPIITGIGHERDDTVLDLVAHTRVKTPTAAAEFLINKMTETENELLYLQNRLIAGADRIIQTEVIQINTFSTHFSYLLKQQKNDQLVALNRMQYKLKVLTENTIKEQLHYLETKKMYLNLVSPQNILKKGYTLTLKDNKIMKSAKNIKKGENITTLFSDGKITSKVN